MNKNIWIPVVTGVLSFIGGYVTKAYIFNGEKKAEAPKNEKKAS